MSDFHPMTKCDVDALIHSRHEDILCPCFEDALKLAEQQPDKSYRITDPRIKEFIRHNQDGSYTYYMGCTDHLPANERIEA